MVNKKDFKKFAKKVKKGFKGSAKAYKKYAPKVHAGLKKTSDALAEGISATPRRRAVVDLTAKPKPKKVYKGKKGVYLDFT